MKLFPEAETGAYLALSVWRGHSTSTQLIAKVVLVKKTHLGSVEVWHSSLTSDSLSSVEKVVKCFRLEVVMAGAGNLVRLSWL